MADINGTIGSDNLHGSNAADVISGADSGDSISGRGGDDVLYGFGAVDADPESGTIQVDRIVTGLDSTLFATAAPGRPNELFVVEQNTGKILIVDLNTNTVAGTFLDIPQNQLSTGGEQGLLGLAFDPNYAQNGKFYVNITNGQGDTEILQYKRSEGNPDQADLGSKKLIMRIDQPFDNHNGGWIGFGPDGFLYIATGDGGSGGDPFGNAQNTDSLLGKILRIDVHGDDFAGDNTKNYAIPEGNPFVGVDGADEVWHYGLRNPWRCSFDTLTGDFYIGDVGQSAHEEIDYVAAGLGGLNFGWNVREGDFPYDGPDDPAFTDPIIDIPHKNTPFGGSTVIGGYVYRGPGGGQGLYFFNDVGSGNFWTTRVVDGEATQYVNIEDYLRGDVGSFDSIVSWGLDGTGRLYAIGLDGEVFRVTPSEAAGDAGDAMRGGDGEDTMFGGAGDDVMNGGADDDTLNGGLGSDTADYRGAASGVTFNLGGAATQNTGGAGTDTLHDIENLSGSRFDDTLSGDGGNNLLSGERGQDTLSGGGGADTLDGGRGVDTLTGASGADRFQFKSVGDSSGNQRDTITDLTNGDIVDVSAIDADTTLGGDQDFDVVSDFSDSAGELILTFNGIDTLLKGDVDGDGHADFVVILTGNHTDYDNFDL